MTNPIITVREISTGSVYDRLAIYAERVEANGSINPRYIGSLRCVNKKNFRDALVYLTPFCLLIIGIPLLVGLLIKDAIERTKFTLNGRTFKVIKSDYETFLQLSGLKEKPTGTLSHLNLHQLIKEKMETSPNDFAKAQDATYFPTNEMALAESINSHDISHIKKEIRKGANVNAEITIKKMVEGEMFLVSKGTPLGYACSWQDKELTQWLLAYGASANPTFKTYTNQGSLATEYKVDVVNSTLIKVE